MIRSFVVSSCIAVLFVVLSSCGRGAGDEPSAGATPSTSTPSAEPTKSEQPSEPPPAKIDQTAFSAQLPAAACDAIQRCKNEDLRGYVEYMMVFMGGFGSLDKTTGLEPIMEKIGNGLKQGNRFLLNQDECNMLLPKLLELQGMTGAKLQSSLDSKRATFDSAAADTCVQAFKNLPSPCSEERRLTKELEMAQVEGLEKQFQKALEEYLAPCGAAIQGTVEDGSTCETDQECKVGKCRRQSGGEGRTCQSDNPS